MKVIPFPQKPDTEPALKPMLRMENSDLIWVMEWIDDHESTAILFVDESEICQTYAKENPWLIEIAAVVPITDAIAGFVCNGHFAVSDA